MEVKPITPTEAINARKDAIPPYVFQAFNELIVEKLSPSNAANIFQHEVLQRILKLCDDKNIAINANMILDRGWLNIEKIYHAEGWKVLYEAPSFDDNFKPHFKPYFHFSKK